MTVDEKKGAVQLMINALTKSNERESNLKKELSDDTMTLRGVQEMILNGDPVPLDCGYDTLEAWEASIEKEITSSNKSLANIEEQKIEVEALQYYVDNIA